MTPPSRVMKPTLVRAATLHPTRIRPREAPRPNRRATLDGWLSWSLVDREGRERQRGEQHNLFLNAGLDAIASSPLTNQTWFTHCAVGTGSVEPDPTDTALGTEIARTSTLQSGGANETTEVGSGQYQMVRTWEFDFDEANGNLTEVAIARAASSNVVVRELFRDSEGDPITVTKTSDYLLRVTYTFTITLTPTTLTAGSFTIDGIGLINGAYMFLGTTHSDSPHPDLSVFGYTAAASTATTKNRFDVTTTALTGVYKQAVVPAGAYVAPTFSPYVGGSYQRSASGLLSVSQGNITIATLGMTTRESGTSQRFGFAFCIDEADRFTKDNEHTLAIDDVLTVTWARA